MTVGIPTILHMNKRGFLHKEWSRMLFVFKAQCTTKKVTLSQREMRTWFVSLTFTCFTEVSVSICVYTHPHMSAYVFTSNCILLLYNVQYYRASGQDLKKTSEKIKIIEAYILSYNSSLFAFNLIPFHYFSQPSSFEGSALNLVSQTRVRFTKYFYHIASGGWAYTWSYKADTKRTEDMFYR